VQDGGYVLIGQMPGVPTHLALSLSLVKRVPDLLLGAPGLLAWRIVEAGRLLSRAQRWLIRSSIRLARVTALSNKLSLSDTVPFWLIPTLCGPAVRFARWPLNKPEISKAKKLRMPLMVSALYQTDRTHMCC
jgi:hypothetical protein